MVSYDKTRNKKKKDNDAFVWEARMLRESSNQVMGSNPPPPSSQVRHLFFVQLCSLQEEHIAFKSAFKGISILILHMI